jgi:rhodanese-related sulfurtransferase
VTGGARAGLLRAAALVAAGVGLGLGCNAVRTEGRVELGRRYFTEPAGAVSSDAASVDGFAVASTDEVAALLADAEAMPGAIVFVDAREAKLFREARIPGALNVDYYRAHQDLEAALEPITRAHRVVVYCGSRDCDDALLLCRELRNVFAVAGEKIRLYSDGLRGWEERGLRVERDGR